MSDPEGARSQNPYAPPGTSSEPGAASVVEGDAPARLPHRRLTYYYLLLVLIQFPLSLMGMFVASLAGVCSALNVFATLAEIVVSLRWGYATWSLVPARVRGNVSPAKAVISSFIPFYNLWWAFAFNLRVARGQDTLLRKYRTSVRAPLTLAWLLPTLSFGAVAFFTIVTMVTVMAQPLPLHNPTALMLTSSLVPTVVTPFLGFVWMARVDTCNAEILVHRARRRTEKSETGDDEPRPRERMKAPRPRKYERAR